MPGEVSSTARWRWPRQHSATVIFLHGFGADGPGRGYKRPPGDQGWLASDTAALPDPPGPVSTLIGETLNLPWVKLVSAIAPLRSVLPQVRSILFAVDCRSNPAVMKLPSTAPASLLDCCLLSACVRSAVPPP
jgi:hypothetical protein